MDEVEKKHRAKVINALHEYYAKGLDLNDEELFTRTLKNESDRGYVILIVSYLEDELLERILKELPQGAKLRRSLLKGGPLRSIEHRMALARAMGIMTEGDTAVFDIFREMRNACAHSRQEISFETPELIETFGLMLSEDTREQMDKVRPSSLKVGFELCAGFLVARLRGQTHEQAASHVNEVISEVAGVPLPDMLKMQKSSPQKPTGKSTRGRRPRSSGKGSRHQRRS